VASIYAKNSRDFAFTVDDLKVAQSKKVKFCNAWLRRYLILIFLNIYNIIFSELLVSSEPQ
jgi:hypothetical protein